MSRSNKEIRAKGLRIDPKTYDPLKEMPDIDPVQEAKRRAKLKKQQKE